MQDAGELPGSPAALHTPTAKFSAGELPQPPPDMASTLGDDSLAAAAAEATPGPAQLSMLLPPLPAESSTAGESATADSQSPRRDSIEVRNRRLLSFVDDSGVRNRAPLWPSRTAAGARRETRGQSCCIVLLLLPHAPLSARPPAAWLSGCTAALAGVTLSTSRLLPQQVLAAAGADPCGGAAPGLCPAAG